VKTFSSAISAGAGINLTGTLALVNSGASTGNATGARLTESYGPVWNLSDSATWHHQVINGSMLCGLSAGGTNWGSGRVVASSEMRATIFYDYSNTAYYIDPNAGSNVFGEFKVNQNTTGGFQLISTTGTQSLWIRTGYSGAPTPSVAATNVQFQSSGSSSGTFNFWCGNSLALTIAGDYAEGAASLRAPIYYDSTNTAYYWNFADAAASNISTIITGFGYFLSNRNTSDNSAPLQAYATGGLGATMAFHRAGVFAVNMGLDSDNVFRIGGWSASNSLIQLDMSGNFTALTSSRGPIFYDSNNTTYYTDPAGSSVMSSIALGGATSVTQGVIWANGEIWLNGNNVRVAFNTDTSPDSTPNASVRGSGNDLVVQNWSGSASNDNFWVFGAGRYSESAASSRAPIFYDSNNTAYYFDGSSTAANALTVAGGIHVSVGNVTGQGIILADDGDIVDLNDGYCAMRFSNGVRVHSGNRTGGAVVALTSGGAVIASGDITAYGSPSDINLKYNIENIPNALEKLLTLNGVNFNYKKDGSRSTGVIAQEVEEVLPEVIYEATDPAGTETFKAVRYGNMVGLLIEAIKEQQTHINKLEDKINSIQNNRG
jgi:hypothetical protein